MKMFNYAAMIVIGALGMTILDTDRTKVSNEEWAIYIVMLFAAWRLVQAMIQWIQENEGGL